MFCTVFEVCLVTKHSDFGGLRSPGRVSLVLTDDFVAESAGVGEEAVVAGGAVGVVALHDILAACQGHLTLRAAEVVHVPVLAGVAALCVLP